MWLYPTGLGRWRDTLSKGAEWGSVTVGFEVETESREKSGRASFTLNPEWAERPPYQIPYILISLIGSLAPILLTASLIGMGELKKR